MKRDVKAEIASKLIEMIREAQASGSEWSSPFKALYSRPTNVATGVPYRSLNAFWLGMHGWSSVATYRQWLSLGYQVQKGTKGVSISVPLFKKDEKTGDRTMRGFTSATVHSSASVLNIETGEPWVSDDVSSVDLTERISIADTYIKNLGLDIRHDSSGRSYYTLKEDFIVMPHREMFSESKTSTATENYYSTLIHEASHATGHCSRLDRLAETNARGYGFEELVAELSSAFLCTDLQVSISPTPDHAQYLAHWLKALGDDSDYIIKAASEAQRVVDWMDSCQVADPLQVAA